MKIEYKIRPVTRFVVTRFEQDADGMRECTTRGEFDNEQVAYDVGYALAKLDADNLKLPPDDMTVIFPEAVGSIGQTLTPSNP